MIGKMLRSPYVIDDWIQSQAARLSASISAKDEPASNGLPPPRLVYRVAGNVDPEKFKEIGTICADTVTSLARLSEGPASADRRVLDFGCGCGRVLGPLMARTDGRFFGADADATLVGEAFEIERVVEAEFGTIFSQDVYLLRRV